MKNVLFALSFVLVSGCVSTTTEIQEKDLDKAVKNRVIAGMEYLRAGDPAGARRHLTRAVELDNNSAEAHNALALLYKYEGDDEREEAHLKRALRNNPDYGPSRNNYGTFLQQQGNLEGALKQFKKAADIVSYNKRDLAYENMGRVYVELGQPKLAIQAFNKGMRLNPDAVAPLIELADLEWQVGSLKTSERYYDAYRSKITVQTPRSLWLGVRLMNALGQKDKQVSFELALEKLYPDSDEYNSLMKWKAKRGDG